MVYIPSGTVEYSSGDSVNLRSVRQLGGNLTFSGGTFRATYNSSWEIQIAGTTYQTGADVSFNELEIAPAAGSNGTFILSDGYLNVSRGLNGYSIYLGGNRRTNNAGQGAIQITGGSLTTRRGVKLGDTTKTGTGHFAVLGSSIEQVGIANSNDDFDGTWWQHGGSTLKVGIDLGGVTTIVLHDHADDTIGTSAIFESGSLLDVDYFDTGKGGGTWTVMLVENGDIVDNGLAFAPGVDTSVWSFNIDNSGSDGVLTVSAVGEPAGIPLVVGSTKKQKMRYGIDYERLWYWTNSMNAAEKDMVSRWSVVDCDVDYIRVAINSKYELEEGVFDRSAYTSKIWPMMHDMQDANPDIKFFASPRPLNEAVSGAAWQPYPRWITGDPGNGNFDFDWQKCAEYLVRYVELMKTEGFKISFMDVTNEWQSNVAGGRVTPSDVRDISEYMQANLAADDMPLLIAPSAWSYSQARSWMSGVNSTRKRDAVDIASAHNTDKTGTAEDFVERVRDVFPDKDIEIWNTELHGWKSTSGADEVLTSSFMFEAINAGFAGINGWLAIGTTNQGHCYILNPNGNPTRNVKYFIFKKLSNSSNYGYALDIDHPEQFKTTSALIRGDLMTVWVINDGASGVPVEILPSDRRISQHAVKRTRWSTSLDVEGSVEEIDVTSDSSFVATVPGNSLCCFEIFLEPEGSPFVRIEAEDFTAQSGTATEPNGDTDGTDNLGYIEHGDWASYDDLTLGSNAVMRFRVARPAGRQDGWIEVRLDAPDGQLVGSVAVPETGNWQTYETIETTLDPVVGTHSIYLRFVEVGSTAGSSLFNFNWFSLPQPVAPDALATAPVTESRIDLEWDAMDGATSYTILRSTASGGPYTTTVATGVVGTTFSDTTGLDVGTPYFYVVSAEYPDGESGYSIQSASVPSDPIDPEAVVIGEGWMDGNEFRVSIPNSGPGWIYQLETGGALGTWGDEGNPMIGHGGDLEMSAPMEPGSTQHFYRARVYRQ